MQEQMNKFDVAVVGGGIVGLANAWMALRKGFSVILFERDRIACGASVRNFGMVWPVGQPEDLFDVAMRSREFWLELKAETGLWANECGSLHLARHDDEEAVIGEFVDQAQGTGSGELQVLSPQEVASKSNAARIDGLKSALWSPYELCVNPVSAVSQLTSYLESYDRFRLCRRTCVTSIESGVVTTGNGQQFFAERFVVCSGSDFETLFPETFESAGLRKCKLQMMSTAVQPDQWRLGPHIAGGLTLRHYQSFESCPSLAAVKSRISSEKAVLDQYGIHVMASQNDVGQVILGDSHQYDEQITPFDSNEIDALILGELHELLEIPDFEIAQRWHGVYAKLPDKHVFISEPESNCKIVTATGGAGMTLSFGIAEQLWENW